MSLWNDERRSNFTWCSARQDIKAEINQVKLGNVFFEPVFKRFKEHTLTSGFLIFGFYLSRLPRPILGKENL